MNWDYLSQSSLELFSLASEQKDVVISMAIMKQGDVVALDSEEWLAMSYFEEWLWFVCMKYHEAGIG